ncbi:MULTISPECIES: hypothetical protein [Pseudomonas]|uniref:hypothetical protein n=1 Tax=Pseudomonas TaxID=286 RepID=UPI000CFF1294|nr:MULTISPECIES: hypothetical protein [Pseudomonas]PRA59270.1 hypothetical protein CQZ98_05415 [Pseudomonas sp. MYb115]QXN49158.1 hypothetical protein KW062_23225 [Pseudomonas fluorescens]WSO23469.1 hypothetical protein VUJ50_23375 [Pseudomonas fluorescens]
MARSVKVNVKVKSCDKESCKGGAKEQKDKLKVIRRDVTQFVLVDEVVDGSFREKIEGIQATEDFWVGVPIDIFNHQHLRVGELRGQIKYQYRFYEGKVYFRTTEYYLTSRPTNKVWSRANIDFKLYSRTEVRKNSPDAMLMDYNWHLLIMNADVELVPGVGVYVNFRVEYDGTNNGVGEKDSWGQQVRLVDRG